MELKSIKINDIDIGCCKCIECGQQIIVEDSFHIGYDQEGNQMVVICDECYQKYI